MRPHLVGEVVRCPALDVPSQRDYSFNINMNLLEQVVFSVVRPSRDVYTISDLGPKKFLVESAKGEVLKVDRADEIIMNTLAERIHLSHYMVTSKSKREEDQCRSSTTPTVIYIHANNGSRMEGQHYIRHILKHEINVVLFDCTGSGISDGNYITLGAKESEDLDAVVEYLVKNKLVTSICLWGRSMGAVTALLYASRTKRHIKACIFDSPFANLKRLVKQIGMSKTGLPEFLLTPVLNLVQKQVEKTVRHKIFSINLIEEERKIVCPGLFITSKSDRLVNSSHVEELYLNYRAKKRLEYISQQHHQVREKDLIDICTRFILENCRSVMNRMYESQFLPQRDTTHGQVKTLRVLTDVSSLKQSMLVHSPSQTFFTKEQQQHPHRFRKKQERTSLTQKISIAGFRKGSFKMKDKDIQQISGRPTIKQQHPIAYQESKEARNTDAQTHKKFVGADRGIRIQFHK